MSIDAREAAPNGGRAEEYGGARNEAPNRVGTRVPLPRESSRRRFTNCPGSGPTPVREAGSPADSGKGRRRRVGWRMLGLPPGIDERP